MAKNNYTQAIAVKNYRQQCGLSQNALAGMLQTSRTQISMVEYGMRELPPQAVALLERLIAEMNKATEVTDTELTLEKLWAADLLVFHKECEERAGATLYHRLQFAGRLKQMVASYPTMLNTYNLLAQQNMEPGEDEVSLRLNLLRWQKKLEQSNRVNQLRLQLKIDLLLAEATVITKFLESC